jgi:hypothetical protein
MRAGYVKVFVLGSAGVIGCGSVKANAPDAQTQTPPDAMLIDAATDSEMAGTVKYDVGYVNDITLTPNIYTVHSFTLVANRGTAPLKLSTTSIVTTSSDVSGVDWQFTKSGSSTVSLTPGRSAGALNSDAMAKLVTSGLVPEPSEDTALDFTMTFGTAPASGLTLHAQAVLRVDTANIVLPFTITVVAGGTPSLNSATRKSSQD